MHFFTGNTIPFLLRYGRLFAVLACMWLSPFAGTAQNISVHPPELQFLFEQNSITQPSYHSIFKPLEVSRSTYDSVFGVKHPAKSGNLIVTPIIDAQCSYKKNDGPYGYRFAQGIYSAGNLGKKAGFELSARLIEQKFGRSSTLSIDSFSIVPGYNHWLWRSGMNTGNLSIRGFIFWKPNRWLTFKAGNDKHFIGDGVRSFFLSENAAAYPFFQTRLNIWKINYTHQLLFMQDIIPDSGARRFNKYATMHTLSINITPKLNFFIFETVVWRAQDSVRKRSFDVYYLNPFLFYRPVEFNMGSPDNVLMGIGGKWIFASRSFFYGQFLIDEFKFKEMKANNGWWANKYAYQAGYKTFGLLKNYSSYFLLEFNNCRPFTYSHTRVQQNYGYLFAPLAHPQGSNFREGLMQFGISLRKGWFLHSSAGIIKYGTDSAGVNLGSDIYKPQYTYTKKYGNTTGQGIANTDLNFGLTISYMVNPAWRLRIFTNMQTTLHQSGGSTTFTPVVNFGFNTWLYE